MTILCVTGVCIFREHDDQSSLEAQMEGGKEQRQRRLRDAGARPLAVGSLDGEALMGAADLLGERFEALGFSELSSDDV